MDAGIGGSLRMLWSAVEGVAIAVGEALAPALKKLTDWFTAATSGMVDYLTKNKQIVVQAAKIIAAVTGIGVALFAVGTVIVVIGKLVGLVVTAIASVAGMVIGTLTLVASVISTIFSPIGLAVLAIAAIGPACYQVSKHADMIGEIFGTVFKAVMGIASRVADAIRMAFQATVGVVVKVVRAIRATFAAMISVVVGLFRRLPGIVMQVFSGIVTVARRCLAAVSAVLSRIASVMSRVWNGITSTVATVFSAVGSIVSGFGNFFLGVFAGIGNAVDWAKAKFGQLCAFAQETYGAIVAALGRGDIEAALGVVWASLQLIWVKGSNTLLTAWDWLVNTLHDIWATCVYKLGETLTKAWCGIQEYWTESVYTMQTIWSEFAANVVSAWKTAEKVVAKGVGLILAKMQGLDPDEMATTLDSMYDMQATAREKKKSDDLKDIQTKRDEKITSLEADKTGALGSLKDDYEAGVAARNDAYNAKLAARQAELDAAKAAYDEAIQRARSAPQTPQGEEESLADKLKEQLQNVFQGFSATGGLSGAGTARGTFNAFGIGGLDDGLGEDQLAELRNQTALLRGLKFQGIPWKED